MPRSTLAWTAAGGMGSPRRRHTLTLLPSGRVLVVGGYDPSIGVIHSAEVYEPVASTWKSPQCGLKHTRYEHTATLLRDGRVLFSAGISPTDQKSAELFTPSP